MKEETLYKLIDKFLNEQATPEEARQVEQWYGSFEGKKGLTELLEKEELEKAITNSFSAFKAVVNLPE